MKSPGLDTQIWIQFWVCGSPKARLFPWHCLLASPERLAVRGTLGIAGRIGLGGSQGGSGGRK